MNGWKARTTLHCLSGWMIPFLVIARSAYAQPAPNAPDQDIAHIRLDAHPTASNSVLFTFDDGGPTLRLPKTLFLPSGIPKDPNTAIKGDSIEMTFWYPDMTPSDWTSSMGKYFDKQRGVYVPELDRFRVHILWMFYSAPEWDDFSSDKHVLLGRDPRPPRIMINRYSPPYVMRRISSSLNGLDMLLSEEWIKKHPEAIEEALHHPDDAVYVAKLDAPYELFMDCRSIECTAVVYSKSHHLQWRAMFAGEAAPHTDELIRAMDQTIARWSER